MFEALKKLSVFKPYEDDEFVDLEYFDGIEEQSNNPYQIYDRKLILDLLDGLVNDKTLCAVSFDGSSETFNTVLLEVQPGSDYLQFDELVPAGGNQQIKRAVSIEISALYHGIRIIFSLKSIETGFLDGLPCFMATLPEEIYYPQRRNFPRITPLEKLRFQGISGLTQKPISGEVHDLSRSGIGLLLPKNRSRLEEGEEIKRCQIRLQPDLAISFELSICYVQPYKQNRLMQQAGGSFKYLSSQSIKKLQQHLSHLEREQLKGQQYN